MSDVVSHSGTKFTVPVPVMAPGGAERPAGWTSAFSDRSGAGWWSCEHEGRGRQSTNGFSVARFQCIGHAEEQDSSLFVLPFNTYSEIAAFPGDE